jgi:ATP-dependent Clp protease ATP-binding subunit ClpA
MPYYYNTSSRTLYIIHPPIPQESILESVRTPYITSLVRDAEERARDEATQLGAHEADSRHLLLGILAGQSSAKLILESFGVTREKILELIKPAGKPEPVDAAPGDAKKGRTRKARVPLSADVIDIKTGEHLGVQTVQIWNVLWEMMHHPKSAGVKLLQKLGVSPEDIRAAIHKKYPQAAKTANAAKAPRSSLDRNSLLDK